jgi:hypothetical protein
MEVKAYKDLDHVYDYDTGHVPVVLVRGGTRLRDVRCVSEPFAVYSGGFLHHLKFMQPPEKLDWRKKAKKHTREVKGVLDFKAPDELRELLSTTKLHTTNIVKGDWY